MHAGGAVQITGSHNPSDYNGFKVVCGKTTIHGEAIQELRKMIDAGDLATGKGAHTTHDVVPAYVNEISAMFDWKRRIKVVIDSGNGTAGPAMSAILKKLNCDPVELFFEMDGSFPNHHPDPSQPKNVAELIERVKREKVDLGLAFDGDGDRLGVITTDGNIIWPDRQLILFARDVLKRNPGGEIIYDVKCSRTVDSAIREAGGKATMWKTGHSFIKAKLKESGALLAGEMSGHIFFRERWYGFDDGLYACTRLLELLSRDPRPTQEVFADLPNTINTPELQLRFAEGEHFRMMDKLARAADFPGATVATIDGLRVDYPDGFGLVRPSNTTPVLVMRFEADTEAALARIQNDFRALFERVEPGHTLPF
jgi:phosphomannomutase/phosphoglucomutase